MYGGLVMVVFLDWWDWVDVWLVVVVFVCIEDG